jgi:hypothetical protein
LLIFKTLFSEVEFEELSFNLSQNLSLFCFNHNFVFVFEVISQLKKVKEEFIKDVFIMIGKFTEANIKNISPENTNLCFPYLQRNIGLELMKKMENSKNSEKEQGLQLKEPKINDSNHSAPQKSGNNSKLYI